MREDLQVLSVADFGAPQFAGKIAAPHAAIGCERVDDLATGVVQIGTGIGFGGAGGIRILPAVPRGAGGQLREVKPLRIQPREPRQR